MKWLERMYRFRTITKKLDDYEVSRYGDIVQFRSSDRKKQYNLVVGSNFLRLEFIVALSKIVEFYNELSVLDRYFAGYLTPLLMKLAECGRKGDCSPQKPGIVKGVYQTIYTDKLYLATNFEVKGEGWSNQYSEILPVLTTFKGSKVLFERFESKKQKPEKKGVQKLIENLKAIILQRLKR